MIRSKLHLLFFFLFSCTNPNNNPSLESNSVYYGRDTVLEGKYYKMQHIVNYDDDGNKINSGYYIEGYPLGLHYYYENSKIYCIRDFVYYTKEEEQLISRYDRNLTNDFDSNLVYLNEVVFVDSVGNIEFDKSSIIHVSHTKLKYKTGDSLKITLKFFESGFEYIDFTSIVLHINNNKEYVRFIEDKNDVITYSEYIGNSQDSTFVVSGVAFLNGLTINKDSGDSSFATRAMIINKTLEIENAL